MAKELGQILKKLCLQKKKQTKNNPQPTNKKDNMIVWKGFET